MAFTGTLLLTCSLALLVLPLAKAQEAVIPDPGLKAAIRESLAKPVGPLTEQDLLRLTNLSACCRSITNVQGLEAAHNLSVLDLESNRLDTFTLPNGLRNLRVLNLSFNPLSNCSLTTGLTNLFALFIQRTELTNLTLPAGLSRLMGLLLDGNRLSNLTLPGDLAHVTFFDLSANQLSTLNLPAGLTSLISLQLWGNRLASLNLPADMTNLMEVRLFFNQLTNFTLRPELKNLSTLDLDSNRLDNFSLPATLTRLGSLHLRGNQLTNANFPVGLTNLSFLDLQGNRLKNLNLPVGMTRLAFLYLSENQLANLQLPTGLTNLVFLGLGGNQLTNLNLSSDLTTLIQVDLANNKLATLSLPPGLTNLTVLSLESNRLATLTLPPDAARLATLALTGNPLTTLILSEPTAMDLAAMVASLRNQGVSVFTYPLAIRLAGESLREAGAFGFSVLGPPGVYSIRASADLAAWNDLGTVTNRLGSAAFNDASAALAPQRFYRAVRPVLPTNMVFVPPATFTMGSPTSDFDSSVDERPQTIVTLSRGFWIAKHEVTEGEYLSLMNTNPSAFPDDLGRAVSSVSWLDATNYCAKLTQRELAAGRIPPGSRYRLPTEAEWECAARAGTSTRFSYGDDFGYASVTNHAWELSNGNLMAHPVGQKLPNPWGLYDMEGNVWEWCQDWYGPLPGGAQTDPKGPASNPIGFKVMRGGAFDYPDSSCRSAARLFFGVSPFLTDWDLGFRVVLDLGPQ